MELHAFEFNRKGKGKNKPSYKALQLATPKQVTLQRGIKKGQVVTKLDLSDYLKLDEPTLRKLLTAHSVSITEALVYGTNKVLRMKASGGGVIDTVILRLNTANYLSQEKDDEKRQTGIRATASTILSLKREKERTGQNWSLDKCFAIVAE